MRQKPLSLVSMTLILITITLFISDYNLRWKNEQWKYAVHTDAADYYRYLPMIFIDQEFDDQAENPSVIKYFAGTSIMYFPFFAVACAISFLVGLPVDGYSMLFPIFISIGTLFYLIFGLYYFAEFLKYYISRSWVICIILIVLTFGTIVFHYTVNTPGWAHIPAFGLVCYLLYQFRRIAVDFNRQSIISIIAGVSFLFFVRPTDVVIVILAPFLAGSFSDFLNTLKKVLKEKKSILIGLFLAAVPVICQIGIYKAYTGEFFIWSYTNEGFAFLHPEINKVLFSYAKGLFVYTPICFLALFGLYRLYKINRYLFWGVLTYLILNVFIISSWWCWNYGYCYGPRAFIEHFPVFFFLLALLMDTKNFLLKISLISGIILLCFVNLFQIYQAENGIFDLDYKTDQKGYWNVFLSTEKGFSGKFYRFPVDESDENIVRRVSWFNDMEKKDTTWLNSNSQVNELAHSGNYASRVNKDCWYSVGLRKKLNEIPYKKNTIIRVSAWFLIPEKGCDSYFAISFVSDGKANSFMPFSMEGSFQDFNKWEYHTIEIYMPKLPAKAEQNPTSIAEFYYFNNSDKSCYIDDLTIEFIEFKQLDRVLDLSWE